MQRRPILSSLMLALAIALPAVGTSAEPTTGSSPTSAHATSTMPETLAAQVPVWLQQVHVPGVAIAKIEDGRLAWTAAFGERAPGTPMTRDTIFNVASLTKPVFALMTLHLVADGKLTLETQLAEDWVDPDIADDPRRDALTPRLALSHQTGFQNWRGNGKLAFAFDPGTRHEYSGEGYEYLRRALERRTGKMLPELMADTVLAKVRMPDTSFGWSNRAEGRIATGYEASGEPYHMDYLRNRGPNAAANMLSTVTDYGRFLAWVARGADLPSALFDEMRKPQLDGEAAERFGLGWRLTQLDRQTVLSHDGRENGVRTQAFVLPDSGDGLVILTSSDNGELLTRPLVAATLSQGSALLAAIDADIWTYLQRMPRAQLPHIARMIAGSPPFMSKLLHAADKALVQPSALFAEDKRAAKAAIDPFVLAMVDGRAGEAQAKALVELLIESGAKGPQWRQALSPEQAAAWVSALSARTSKSAAKAPPPVTETMVTVPEARLATYAGDYLLPSNQLLIRITKTASGLEATAKGMPVVKLYPQSQTLFAMQEDKTRFEFVPGTDDKASGVRVIWSEDRSEAAKRIE